MKVLFAVNNEKVAESITRKYQEEYKEIITSKTVYYYNAIIKELQKDKTYDRIIIGEDLEPFASDNYQAIDKYIFEKMDIISDEATNVEGDDIPIILIGLDRRTKNDPLLLKLFGLGIYNVLIGQDRSIQKVCGLMYKPRSKKEAKAYYKVETENIGYETEKSNGVNETEIQNILNHYKKIGNNIPKCVQGFESINSQYSKEQIKLIIEVLPVNVKVILEENSDTYRKIMGIKGKKVEGTSKLREQDYVEKEINTGSKLTKPVIIPTTVNTKKVMKIKNNKNDDEKISKQKEIAETKKKAEEERIAKQQALAEAKKKEEERKAKEKAELEAKKKEEEKLARQKAIEEAKKKAQESIAKQKALAEARKKEKERLAKEKAELEAKKKEEERLAKEKAELEAKKKEEERLAKEKAELEAKKKEEQRLAKEKAELEAKKKKEQRLAKEKAKAEAKKKEEQKIAKEKEEITVESAKRGRGRPRKTPIIVEEEVVPIKRKRGRPRKNEVEEETQINNDDIVVNNVKNKSNDINDDYEISNKKKAKKEENVSEFDEFDDGLLLNLEDDIVDEFEELENFEEEDLEEELEEEFENFEDGEDLDDEFESFEDDEDLDDEFESFEDEEDLDDEFESFEDEEEDLDDEFESFEDEEDLEEFESFEDEEDLDDEFESFEDEEDLEDEFENFEDEEDLEDEFENFEDEEDLEEESESFEDEENLEDEFESFEEEDNNEELVEDDEFDFVDNYEEEDLDFIDEEEEIDELPGFEDEEEEIDELPGFEDEEEEIDELPGFEDEEEEIDELSVFEDEEDEIDELLEFEDEEDEIDELPGFEDEEDEIDELPGFEDEEDEIDELPGFEDEEDEIDELPGFEDEEDEIDELPGFEDEEDEINELPGFEDEEDDVSDLLDFDDEEEHNEEPQEELPVKQHNGAFGGINNRNYKYDNNLANSIKDLKETESSETTYNIDTDNLITGNQKIVSFVGTTKNGTSFVVNNLAEVFSNKGIKTAILDLTKNKNSYYIYTNNEEQLRQRAHDSFEKLTKGIAEGVEVNKNLSVYTSLPGNDESLDDVTNIIQTLLENYTVVLMDCDFSTDPRYFKAAQEIYLVQSLDVLTIQPLTAFLRDLKVKGILESYKLRIVINKNIKVNSLNDRILIGGMSVYNDPAMTYMTELFDKETIKYVTIPFDNQAYVKYLEAIVNCKISTKGYSKNMLTSLNNLSDMVYPTLNGKKQKKFNDYSKNNKKYEDTFSKNTSSTLIKMKKKI